MQSVLLIDDDLEISSLLGEILQGAGYRVVIAHTISEANFKLSRQRFTVVVADLKLGADDGEQIINKMRVDGNLNCATPVVVISAFIDTPVVLRLKHLVQGVLVKPFMPKILVERIKTAKEMGVLKQEPDQAGAPALSPGRQ